MGIRVDRVVLCAAWLLAPSAFSQAVQSDAGRAEGGGAPDDPAARRSESLAARPGLGLELRAGYRLDPRSHYRNGCGAAVQRFMLGAAKLRPLGGALLAAVDARVGVDDYDLNRRDDTPFGAEGLMRDALGLRLGLMVTGPIRGPWNWLAGGSISAAGERDADLAKALDGSALVGAGYAAAPDLKLTLSLAAFGFEGGVPVVPVPGIDWALGDRWRLWTPGPGLDLVRTLDARTTVTFRARWEYHHYRLDDGPPVPGGAFYDQRVRLGVEATRRFGRVLEIALEGGATVYQQLQVRDRDNHTLADTEGSPSAYAGLRAGLRL